MLHITTLAIRPSFSRVHCEKHHLSFSETYGSLPTSSINIVNLFKSKILLYITVKTALKSVRFQFIANRQMRKGLCVNNM